MKIGKTFACMAASLGVLAIIGVATAPKMNALIKAAYVELVLPDKPFTYDLDTNNINGGYSIGPGTGTLGVTSLTITNYDSNPQDIFVFVPQVAGQTAGSCSGIVTGVSGPSFHVIVQGVSTLHLPYPSPLVFSPNAGGSTCMGLQAGTPRTGNVNITVNGFVN